MRGQAPAVGTGRGTQPVTSAGVSIGKGGAVWGSGGKSRHRDPEQEGLGLGVCKWITEGEEREYSN